LVHDPAWCAHDVVFDAFGEDRLMFGSDWPVCRLAGSYQQVKRLIETYVGKLSVSQKNAVFGLNAVRFYGLENTSNGPAT